MKKKLISLLLVLVLTAGILTVPSLADTNDNGTFAYLMYADASWTNQYWGNDDPDSGITATNADITGPGEYTVGLDFTGTEAGEAKGIALRHLASIAVSLSIPTQRSSLSRSGSTEKK